MTVPRGFPRAVCDAARSDLPPPVAATSAERSSAGDFLTLRIWAESFEDAQRARISCENRMLRGGIDPELFAPQLEALERAEHEIKLAMVRAYRRLVREYLPGVEPWAKSRFGIGEHLLARLLGTTGHPRIATPYQWMNGDTPDWHECDPARCGSDRHLVALPMFERSVRQWYAFCGYVPGRKRQKGMSAEDAFALGNPRAKMVLHLLAESTIKCRPNSESVAVDASGDTALAPPVPRSEASDASAGQPLDSPMLCPSASVCAESRPSPTLSSDADVLTGKESGQPAELSDSEEATADRHLYRHVYDAGRLKYADRDDWTLGHQHNAALRLVAKRIARDLWAASK